MEVNFSDTNLVTEILCMQPPSLLVLTQSGISINLSSGEVIIPENLELSVVSREFWNSVDNLAKTRISELEAQLAEEKQKVADLENPAAFGWQCYQDRCENAYVERSVVKRLEAALQVAREFISYSTCLCIGGEFPVECKRCTTLARIGDGSRG